MITSRCGHFVARDLSVGRKQVNGELLDARGKSLKVFKVKRHGDLFKVGVGSSGHKATFDVMDVARSNAALGLASHLATAFGGKAVRTINGAAVIRK